MRSKEQRPEKERLDESRRSVDRVVPPLRNNTGALPCLPDDEEDPYIAAVTNIDGYLAG